MESVKGKVVLGSDGTEPTGERIIRHLLENGAKVVVSSDRAAEIENLHFRLAQDGVTDIKNLETLPFDLGDPKEAAAARNQTELRWQGLDAVVANYDFEDDEPSLVEASDADWDRVINHCMKSQFNVAKTFIPLLAKRKNSVFVTVSSSATINPAMRKGLVSASHAFQVMLAQSLSNETSGHPSVHNLILTKGVSPAHGSEDLITPDNVGEAITLLIENADTVRGQAVIGNNWREFLEPSDEGYTISGI